jgi:alkylation response protein AidB-like acyl-CoA dehydrogenase
MYVCVYVCMYVCVCVCMYVCMYVCVCVLSVGSMRAIGMAERALDTIKERARTRVAFGKPLIYFQTTRTHIAESRMEIDQARMLVLKAAYLMDTVGNKVAKKGFCLASDSR